MRLIQLEFQDVYGTTVFWEVVKVAGSNPMPRTLRDYVERTIQAGPWQSCVLSESDPKVFSARTANLRSYSIPLAASTPDKGWETF